MMQRYDSLFTGILRTHKVASSQLDRSVGSTAPVSQKSWVRIPFRPEFFSGFIFTTAQVVCIMSMINHIFVLWEMLFTIRKFRFYTGKYLIIVLPLSSDKSVKNNLNNV